LIDSLTFNEKETFLFYEEANLKVKNAKNLKSTPFFNFPYAAELSSTAAIPCQSTLNAFSPVLK
jgi:hypothetical protein